MSEDEDDSEDLPQTRTKHESRVINETSLKSIADRIAEFEIKDLKQRLVEAKKIYGKNSKEAIIVKRKLERSKKKYARLISKWKRNKK